MASEFHGTWEGRVLAKMLAMSFPGALELRAQACRARTTVIRGDVPRVLFDVDPDLPPADVQRRVPVEAVFGPEGDACIHCLLHVVTGRLDELQFYREDGRPISDLPDVDDMRIVETP